MERTEPEICSCSALRQASRHVSRIYDAALAPAGLGINQYAILSRLHRHGPLAQGELAERLVMERSTVGHLLKPLQRRGLVEVSADPADRRRRVQRLSAHGRECYARARPLWARAQRDFAAAFGPARTAELAETLLHVTDVAPATGSERSR